MESSESNTRSLVFLACMMSGLFLMIPAAWAGHFLLSRVELADWMESVIGLAIALAPLVLLIRFAARRLELRYPDSAPGRIPEPHERPSSHKASKF
jgi:hypothetical protein